MSPYELVLLSPTGSEPLVYSLPMAGQAEATEIVKSIKWAGKDHPELREATGRMCENYDAACYNDVGYIVDSFNEAVKRLDQNDVQTRINKRPSRKLLKHILNQVYAKAIKNPNDLNNYEPFTPEVYGEASFGSVNKIIEFLKQLSPITTSDRFIDLGSGIGQVVLQVAALTECKGCIGIEKADIPASRAREMDAAFRHWMAWFGKKFSPYKLIQGDFLSTEHQDLILDSNLVFVNNLAFGPSVDHKLKQLFVNMNNGTKIVSSANFCPLNFRITNRNTDDIGAIMNIRKMEPVVGSGSWTNTPFSYYLHVIDFGKLEEFYQAKKIIHHNPRVDELKRTRKSLSLHSEKGFDLRSRLNSSGSSPCRSLLSSNSSPSNSLASSSQFSSFEDITEVSRRLQSQSSNSSSSQRMRKSKKVSKALKRSLNNSVEVSDVSLVDQNGEDHEGILGFLPDDIDAEVRRGQHLKCSLCKKNNATIGCCVRSCKKTFHLPCMQLTGGLNQFFGSFESFCNEHKPKQRVPGLTWTTKTTGKGSKMTKTRHYGTSPCGVCLDVVSKKPSVDILWTPCCNGWFHRNCVEYMAETAGSTFFKCPLCNNKEVFEREMQKLGIYIPLEDAKWETEPSAYEDLYKRHSRCDEKTCLCPSGRGTNQEDTDWEIVLCEMCGASGVHVACGQLDPVFLRWKCETCSTVAFKSPKLAKSSKWLVDSDTDDNVEKSSVGQCSEGEEPTALEGCSTDYHPSQGPIVIDDSMDEDGSRSSSRSTRGSRMKIVPDVTLNYRQRGRCGECAGCSRDNCGECRFCLDMKRFGGPNKLRQACMMRKCNPQIELDDGDHDECGSIEAESAGTANTDVLSPNLSDSRDEGSVHQPEFAAGSSVPSIWNWNCKIDLVVTSQVGEGQNNFPQPDNSKKEGLWRWDCRVDVERLPNWKDFVGPRKSELKCQSCDFLADSPELLERHQRLHDPSRQFVCSICQYRFVKERHVEIHERIHTGEKPHKCDMCGERFAESWCLKIHMSKHNNRRKYVCRFCKWRFKSFSLLKVHEVKHFKTPTVEPPSTCSDSFRQITSTITSNPSSFPLNCQAPNLQSTAKVPCSPSEGRRSRRDSQASNRSFEQCAERSPSNCSVSSLPDMTERCGSISPTARMSGSISPSARMSGSISPSARMSPFLQGLELTHVSASPVIQTPKSRLTPFQNPLEHLHPLETELSSLVKIEDTGFLESISASNDEVQIPYIPPVTESVQLVYIPPETESVQSQTPNLTFCAQVPINPVVIPRITTRATRQAQVSSTASPQVQTAPTNANMPLATTLISEQVQNTYTTAIAQETSTYTTAIAQETSTPIVIPRITKASGSVPGEDRIVPVYSRIVTRTKSGIRPRESFTKYASPPRTKVHVEEGFAKYASPPRTKAHVEEYFTKYASPTRTKSDVEESFTKYASPPRTKAHVEDSFTKYASPTRTKSDVEDSFTRTKADVKESRTNVDHEDHVISDDDIEILEVIEHSGYVSTAITSKNSSRSSSCSKKPRIVNQLADFLGRGLREEPVSIRLSRGREKRRKSENTVNIGNLNLSKNKKRPKKIDSVKGDTLNRSQKKGGKMFTKKKSKKKRYDAVIKFVDEGISKIYDIEDINLETHVIEDDLQDFEDDFDGDPADYVDPISIDPLIDDPVDSFVVSDEIILEGSAVIEAINESDPEMDPLEQSDEVDVKHFKPEDIPTTNEKILENDTTRSKTETKEITPIDLKSEFLEAATASDDEMSHASIVALSDEILCSEVGTEESSETSVIAHDEDVPDSDTDLITGHPDEEKNASGDLDHDTCSEINGEPEKITDELDEREAMILRMSSCELIGEAATARNRGSGDQGSTRDTAGISRDQASDGAGSSIEQLPTQDESLLGMEEYDDDFDERPLVNFLELCEDS